jgi:hypothetical protein
MHNTATQTRAVWWFPIVRKHPPPHNLSRSRRVEFGELLSDENAPRGDELRRTEGISVAACVVVNELGLAENAPPALQVSEQYRSR